MKHMGVSKNNGTKSSILIGFSIINHPFWGTPIFGDTHIGNIPWHEKSENCLVEFPSQKEDMMKGDEKHQDVQKALGRMQNAA